MQTVTLTGRQVPAIGIGTWHMGDDPLKQEAEIAAIQAGLDAGAQVIDTAEMYGSGRSETLVGKAIKNIPRDQLYLISKVLPNNASKAKMSQSLDASLKRLGVDALDLYLYHWRGGVPLVETVDELERLKTTGKIKAWGISNFDTDDLKELWQLPSGPMAAANEDLYNLGSRGVEYDLLAWQTTHNLPFIAYSPVSNGDQLGANLTTNANVLTVANRHHATPYQIMLAWVISRPQILAIPQTSDATHMVDNVTAGNLKLTADDLKLLDQAYPAPTEKQPLDVL
ncbi:aldo keto reductase [Secundilactobacillus odoratitofui DSM 19909 = JCM 15043]|uniref:Aldo keto reductase n=1 Tax=Secundilactobacillus odoratitofui DSM 19909 = JCM 15043 TaxID=1423776 RepID=A0A0R1LZX6_9LACO|nr:aldo/keto reductase [Secundilactobacillus odoratitofui]KRK98457.1 aldo keto reductase [Secundilactobacillus odoratitofui DSM 19909 = JCM 15043]